MAEEKAMWIFVPIFQEWQENLQICGFLKRDSSLLGRCHTVHLLSYRQFKGQPHRAKKKKLMGQTEQIKKYRKPDSREGGRYHSRTNSTASYLPVLEVCEWDHSDYLWNRAFLFALPAVRCPRSCSALVSFPPRSPGERTKQ